MAERKSTKPSWRDCQAVLKTWPQPGLTSLIHELYELSRENTDFLRARVLPNNSEHPLSDARAEIRKLLTYRVVINDNFRHSDVKRVIDRFQKATDDPVGVADLLVFDIDVTCQVFWEVGDYEPLVDHAYAQMTRLEKVLSGLGAEVRAAVVEKLQTVADRWQGKFEYGLSDELADMAATWTERQVKSLWQATKRKNPSNAGRVLSFASVH